MKKSQPRSPEPCPSLLKNLLRHVISQHASARVSGLGTKNFVLFPDKTNVFIDRIRFRIPFSFGVHELLLGKRDQQLVGVLAVAQSDQIRCVDLVQHCNLTIEVRVRREGVGFEILYRDGDLRRVGTQATEQIHGALVRTIRELNGCVVGLDTIKLLARYVRKSGSIGVELLSRSLIAVLNTKATVDGSGPGGGRAVSVGHSRIP